MSPCFVYYLNLIFFRSTIYIDHIEGNGKRRLAGVYTICCEFMVITGERAVGLDYNITGRSEMTNMHNEPQIECWVHLMDLTSDDRHNMQLDPKHIPTPTINDRLSSSFCLPTSVEPA